MWATKNYTGALKHYITALQMEPENEDTLNTLRGLKCIQRYQQATQSIAMKDSENPAAGSNCPSKPPNMKGHETESRVICKTVSQVFQEKF